MIIMNGAQYERELVNDIMNKTDWEANRSSGSSGLYDVSLFSPSGIYFWAEVKSNKGKTYYTSNNSEQHKDLVDYLYNNFPTIYIIRWKNINDLRGLDKIYKKEVFSPIWYDGIFKYDSGIPLPKFIKKIENLLYDDSRWKEIFKILRDKNGVSKFFE